MARKWSLMDLLEGYFPVHAPDAEEDDVVMILGGERVNLSTAAFDSAAAKSFADAALSMRRTLSETLAESRQKSKTKPETEPDR